MKNLKLGVLVVIGCILVLSASIAFANLNIDIGHFFKEKENKLTNINEGTVVISSDEFTITLKEYIDYRENIKLIHTLNNIPFTKTPEELVNNLINNRLFLQYAKKQNIEVTDEEVMEYAMQTKKVFSENQSPEFDELLKGLANSLGVSEEDYFTHPKTLENYRNLLLTQKAAEQLYEEGTLEDNGDNSALNEFIEGLRKEGSGNIHIDLNKIKKIDVELNN